MKINAAVLALLSCLVGCAFAGPPNIPPQTANAVSLNSQDWYIYYSAGLPPHPSADIKGAWSFDFPSSVTGGHVNYVQTPFNATTTPHNVSVTFRVESSAPQYEVLDPGDHPPATVHLFIEQQGDNLSSANGRWWADPSYYNLGSQDGGTISFNVPLTADKWSNVYGHQDGEAFSAALRNIGWVGLTYGGQYFWGHGVALAGGNAQFILIDYHIN
jgi:hypothetical protein